MPPLTTKDPLPMMSLKEDGLTMSKVVLPLLGAKFATPIES